MSKRQFPTEFRLEAARLVLDANYSTAQACEAMGVGATALRRWVEQLRQERGGVTPETANAMTAEQQQIQALHAKIRKLEIEKEIPKKGYRSLDVRFPRSVTLIEKLSERFTVIDLCRVFGMNRSRYYDYLKQRDRVDPDRERLKFEAIQLHTQSRRSMGARSLSAALKARGEQVGRFLAGRLMAEAGLQSCQRRPRPYRHSVVQSRFAENLLERQFEVSAPNQVWCGDITYIWAGTHWVYLAAVLDLYARRIVGWAISSTPDSTLTCKALALAHEARGKPHKVMFHSDQGCQYSSEMFRTKLESLGMQQSMSRRGNCWDNAPMERFFGSLKSEWIPKKGYRNEEEACPDVLRYVIHHYNQVRLHSYNEYRTPVDQEKMAA
ncbi:IS3 family transposase [Pseudomonas syringae]|uniref:IS3 family transposase n=2 Tax=Pseudomonas syringae TaxID=317 RepID=UPI003F840BF2